MNGVRLYHQLPHSARHEAVKMDFSNKNLCKYLARRIWTEEDLKKQIWSRFVLPKEKQVYLWQKMQLHKSNELEKAIEKDLQELPWVNRHLHLQGYLRFGAKYLQRYLLDLANTELKILQEKEAEESFVQLVQFLLDLAEPMCEEAILLRNSDGTIGIYDAQGFDLKQEYKAINKIKEDGIKEEDLILSALITLAPKKIFCDKNLLEEIPIVWRVFQEKIIHKE